MTAVETTLILAAAGQVLLTCVAFAALGLRRGRAIAAGLDPQRTAADLGRYPEPARVAAASVTNQFETPVLFFAAIAIALATGLASQALGWLAWIWLATRAAHMAIHLGPNAIKWRGLAFLLGLAALLAMWIILAARAITG